MLKTYLIAAGEKHPSCEHKETQVFFFFFIKVE